MKYELINKPNDKYSAKQQIFINRGIKENDLVHYMNLTDDDINPPEMLGEELLRAAATAVKVAIDEDQEVCIIVD